MEIAEDVIGICSKCSMYQQIVKYVDQLLAKVLLQEDKSTATTTLKCNWQHFAQEHRFLQMNNSQKIDVERPGERAYLKYTEDVSKNRHGGLKGRPIGHDTLSKTLPRLYKSAGIQGYKTNHSLRASAATRLYRSGIDEQLVMERTGHRSLEGVKNYKSLSDVLNMEPRMEVSGTNMVSTSSSSS